MVIGLQVNEKHSRAQSTLCAPYAFRNVMENFSLADQITVVFICLGHSQTTSFLTFGKKIRFNPNISFFFRVMKDSILQFSFEQETVGTGK